MSVMKVHESDSSMRLTGLGKKPLNIVLVGTMEEIKRAHDYIEVGYNGKIKVEPPDNGNALSDQYQNYQISRAGDNLENFKIKVDIIGSLVDLKIIDEREARQLICDPEGFNHLEKILGGDEDSD